MSTRPDNSSSSPVLRVTVREKTLSYVVVSLLTCNMTLVAHWAEILLKSAMKFCTNIHGSQRKNYTDFSVPLTFEVVVKFSAHIALKGSTCEFEQY